MKSNEIVFKIIVKSDYFELIVVLVTKFFNKLDVVLFLEITYFFHCLVNLFIVRQDLKHCERINSVNLAIRITNHCLASEKVALFLITEEIVISKVAA